MTNDPRIKIEEKPDRVSWGEIHNVLWKAHEQNRQRGMYMSLPSKSAEDLQKYIEGKGKMFVAMDGEKVIGTLALIIKEGKQWYNRGRYGYACLGAVLLEYSGKGVFRALYDKMEAEARHLQLPVLTRDTHESNVRMLKISKQEGYSFVSYKVCSDHFNIVRAKWLGGCPYPSWYIILRFHLSKTNKKLRYRVEPGVGRIDRFAFIRRK